MVSTKKYFKLKSPSAVFIAAWAVTSLLANPANAQSTAQPGNNSQSSSQAAPTAKNDSDYWSRILSLSGFGTFGLVYSDTKYGDFVGSKYQVSGAGRTRHADFGTDTKFGLQLNAQFNEKLLGVAQVIALSRSDNDFSPAAEWAYLQYQVTDDLKVRGGRTALPVFMVSDYRLVSYANPWIRPPVETYLTNSVTTSDGVDASYKLHLGDTTNTLQMSYGRSKVDTVTPVGFVFRDSVGKNLANLNYTFEKGSLLARIGVTKVDIHGIIPNQVVSPTYTNAGFIYDAGDLFLQSEYTRQTSNLYFTTQEAAYATLGYHFRKLSPYTTYSQIRPTGTRRTVAVEQTTVAAGVRWEVAKNVALKAQWDHVKLGDRSSGYFIRILPQTLNGRTVNLGSLALDFVF